MTIKVIYKVEGDNNEYDSEQEAHIAECCKNYKGMFLTPSELYGIAKAISEKYFLAPILKTETTTTVVDTGTTSLDDDDIPF